MDMAIIKKLVSLNKKEYFWISVLTLLVLFMHFSIIVYPRELIFDEVYYVNDARGLVTGTAQLRGEHPPLSQLLVAGGIYMFGDNALGWRFTAVIAGSANIFLFYLICRRLKLPWRASFLASFLMAFETLSFVQSSVAMQDVFSVFFMLLAFWMYLRGSYPLAVLAGCLATLTKLSGAFTFPVIGLHWLIMRRDRPWLFITSMVLALPLFGSLLSLTDLAITGKFGNPVTRIDNMLALTRSVTWDYSDHPSKMRPWEWLTRLRGHPYYYDPDYLAFISPTLWALIIPFIGYIAFRTARVNNAALFALLWFVATYLVWIPLVMFTNRVTYLYYFYPVVGAVCIGVSLALSSLYDVWWNKTKKLYLRIPSVSLFFLYLALHLVSFIMLSPVFMRWLEPLGRKLL
jgi:predicted membrane-bound dolichyl-phosphate-mannose-protein mannosyltransferase